jgi:hypothetical protein
MLSNRTFVGIAANLAGLVLVVSRCLGAPPAGYLPVYSEEFNGTNLNRKEWTHRTDAKVSAHRPENVSVGNGLLRIALKKESYNGKNYTAGGVVSYDGWRYGYYETRMRVWADPNWHAAFWTAHWLSLNTLADGILAARDELGGGDVPRLEIDFIEQDSANNEDYNAGVIHWFPGGNESRGRTHFAVPDMSAGFHTVGGEFLPDRVRFYFDGQPVKEAFHADFAHADSFVWLTCIANSSGVVDANLPGESVFDYFRFYSRQDVVPEEFEIHNVQARRPLQTRNLEVLGSPEIVVANDPNVYRRIAWQVRPVPGGGVQFRNSFGSLALQSPVTGQGLEPVADVRLRSGAPDDNQGAANNLGAGPIQSGDVFRTVFAFDMTSAALPLDALVLELTLERDGSAALTNLPQNFTLHLLNKAFVEGEASWNSAASVDLWASPGGDFSPALCSTNLDPYAISTGQKLRLTLDSGALASVNAVLQTNAMLGLLLKSDAEGSAVRSFIWMNSREDLGKEPRLLYTSSGTPPLLGTDTFALGDPGQVFVLEDQGGGEVAIRHQASGHYVRMADGLILPIDVELKPLASVDARARWTLVPANAVERYFPGTATLPDRWFRSWLGHLYENDSFPNVFHRELGWIHIEGVGGTHASFHHPNVGWMWTGPEFWPLAYSESSSNWVAIERGTNGTSLRAFSFAVNSWASLGSAAMETIDMQALVEAGDDADFAPPGSGAPAPPGSAPSWAGVPFTPPLLVEAGEVGIRPTGEPNKWLLLFNSPADRRHRLITSLDLINWAPLSANVLFPGRTHYLQVDSADSARYFRVVDQGAAY